MKRDLRGIHLAGEVTSGICAKFRVFLAIQGLPQNPGRV